MSSVPRSDLDRGIQDSGTLDSGTLDSGTLDSGTLDSGNFTVVLLQWYFKQLPYLLKNNYDDQLLNNTSSGTFNVAVPCRWWR